MSRLSIKSLHEAIYYCPDAKEEIASITGLSIKLVGDLCLLIYNYNNHSMRLVYAAVMASKPIRVALSEHLFCTPSDIQVLLQALSRGAVSPLCPLLAQPTDTLVHVLSFLSLVDLSGLDKAVCNWTDRTVLFSAIHTERLVFDYPSNSSSTNKYVLNWIRSRGVNLRSLNLSRNHTLLQTHAQALDEVSLRSVKNLRIDSSTSNYGIDTSMIATLELIDNKCTAINHLHMQSQDPLFMDACLNSLISTNNRLEALILYLSNVNKLGKFPSLKFLFLFSSTFKPLCMEGVSLPNLHALLVSDSVLNDENFKDLIQQTPKLVILDIDFAQQLSENGLCSQFVYLKNLICVKISDDKQPTLHWTKIFTELLNNCPRLSKIKIAAGSMDNNNDKAFHNSVIPTLRSNGKSLDSLHLNGSIKLPSTIIAAIFNYCPRLNDLSFAAIESLNLIDFSTKSLESLIKLSCKCIDSSSTEILLNRLPSLCKVIFDLR